mmetsp:Transcript_38759/g.80496  ORF Transcript_38759/g.80496 Transcript_38759/m.80496 type:complete len:226 (-) Transcript_38759:933-1610(-)
MNIFRLAGDMSHVFSILVLLLRLRVAKNAQGISVRTHELYLLVFITRYLDLFTSFYSVYNTVMKILFLACTASIIYTIRFQEPIKTTYDKAQDSFLHWKFAVAPCVVIALITHFLGSGFAKFDIMELLWTFSIYLESVTILPQLIVLQRYKEVENLTGNYVFFMGAYRALYILNWIYRAHTEKGYKHHWVVYFCGVLQTLLYADFFYYYVKAKSKGAKLSLPTTS